MYNNLKLKIITKAVKIRVKRGEKINYILDGYKELTEDEKKYILENI